MDIISINKTMTKESKQMKTETFGFHFLELLVQGRLRKN